MAVNTGNINRSVDITNLRNAVNNTATRYGVALLSNPSEVGNKNLSSNITAIKDKLTQLNNDTRNTVKVDLAVITSFSRGELIKPTVLNLLENLNTTIYNAFCACDCNYVACTCDCNYVACPCQCNYACTCNCNHSGCSCQCDNSCSCVSTCSCQSQCSCQCAYSCTCQCAYSCTCHCAYCTCQCVKCSGAHG